MSGKIEQFVGRLTADESEELLSHLIEQGLTEEQLFRVLNAQLTKNQKDELVAQWDEEAGDDT